MLEFKVYKDGACGYKVGGNLVGIGVYAISGSIEYEHAESYGLLGNNMVAEWMALVRALELCYLIESRHGRCVFKIYGDNQPVIRHMQRVNKGLKKDYKQYYHMANELQKKLRYVSYKWIPRELNTKADFLSKVGRLKWFEE